MLVLGFVHVFVFYFVLMFTVLVPGLSCDSPAISLCVFKPSCLPWFLVVHCVSAPLLVNLLSSCLFIF